MIQASFAAGFKKVGMLKELPPGVNPDNVKFVEEHEDAGGVPEDGVWQRRSRRALRDNRPAAQVKRRSLTG